MKLTALIMRPAGDHWSLLRDVPGRYLEMLEHRDWVVLETWPFSPSIDAVFEVVRAVR